MGIADRYILKQILSSTLFAVLILCGVFLMGTVLKEARTLLVGQNPSFFLIFQFVWSVIPLSLMFIVPCGFLAAVLLTFGRLSSNNELTALKMSGRSLYRISLPVFLLAICFSILGFWLNSSLAPEAKALQKKILYQAIQTDPHKLLDPGVVRHQLKGKIVFVEERDNDRLFGLHVFEQDPREGSHLPTQYVYAREAKLYVDEANKELRLKLYDAAIASSHKAPVDLLFIEKQEPLLFDFSNKKKRTPKANTMTSAEIAEELSQGNIHNLSEKKQLKRSNSLTNEMYGRYAASLSCIAFSFIGIPLALQSRRKETSTGFVISIGIAVIYFTFFIIGNDHQGESPMSVQPLYWAPNIIAIVLGSFLIWRSHRR